MASDLISRDALLDELDDWYKSLGGTMNQRDWIIQDVISSAMDTVNEAPSVDAVEVVRCKDCKYWTRVSRASGKCPFMIGENRYAFVNHYCSCGEWREEDAVD